MTIDRRLLAGALGLSLVVAACGGSSTASSGAGTATQAPGPTATTPATATEAPVATEEATEAAATDEPTEGPTDDSGTVGQINNLAAMLPEKAGDITFERVGYDGDQLGALGAAAGLNAEELDPILKANGKTINDVNFAIATSTSSEAGGMIYAIQIEGVPATTFAEGMNTDIASMPKLTLDGKTVYGQAEGGFGFFAYPKDDILFLILLVDEKTAGDIVGQLP